MVQLFSLEIHQKAGLCEDIWWAGSLSSPHSGTDPSEGSGSSCTPTLTCVCCLLWSFGDSTLCLLSDAADRLGNSSASWGKHTISFLQWGEQLHTSSPWLTTVPKVHISPHRYHGSFNFILLLEHVLITALTLLPRCRGTAAQDQGTAGVPRTDHTSWTWVYQNTCSLKDSCFSAEKLKNPKSADLNILGLMPNKVLNRQRQ